jgi:site-specific recombinase XerD
MTTALIPSPAPGLLPARLFAPTPKAARRVVEFFTAQINNDHTRKAYVNAARRFAEWCEAHGLDELAQVQPFHVAAFVKELQGQFSPPTVKQHLAALRMLFDWLVTGHVLDTNPAHAVRGPRYVVTKGKTPVLDAEEARALLDSIITKVKQPEGTEKEQPTVTELPDRALIGILVYTFARVNAVISMKVKDYFTQGRRSWVRLHEKGGKEHEVPCHHILEELLDAYLAAAGIKGRPGRAAVPHSRAEDQRPPRRAGDVAAGRLPDDTAAREGGGHQDQNRQPHLPGDRHHRLSQEQGHPGARADARQPRLPAHYQALRPALGRNLARRGGED